MTTETETTGAAGTPKRRRTARKPADAVAGATTTKPRARARRTTAEDAPSASGTVAPPTRSTRSRTRRAAAAPDSVTPESGLVPERPAADPTEAGSFVDAEPASGTTAPDGRTPEPQTGEPAETSSAAEESAGGLADPAQGITAPESASGVDSPAAAPEASGQIVAAPEHASPVQQRVDFPATEVRHPVSTSRPARPTFKQSVLRAAEERFVGDRVREPVTAQQVDEMLVLLHRPGQIRSLKDATYDFLRRGMSKRHAEVQLEKLRAAVDPARERAAA